MRVFVAGYLPMSNLAPVPVCPQVVPIKDDSELEQDEGDPTGPAVKVESVEVKAEAVTAVMETSV